MSSSAPQLLEQCPRCEYLLHGLPERHRCPECGLEIDRRWRVLAGRTMDRKRCELGGANARLMGRKPAELRRTTASFVVLIIVACYLLLFAMFQAVVRTLLSWITMLFLTIAIAFAGRLFPMLWKTSCFLAVGPDGLVVYFGRNRLEQHPWSRVGRAEYTVFGAGVSIAVGSKKLFLSNGRLFYSDMFFAEQCASEINAYPRPQVPST